MTEARLSVFSILTETCARGYDRIYLEPELYALFEKMVRDKHTFLEGRRDTSRPPNEICGITHNGIPILPWNDQ